MVNVAAIARSTEFPDPAEIVAQHDIPNDAGYPVSEEIPLVWTMLATHQEQFKGRGIRVNAASTGPVETPILQQFRDVLGDERVNSNVDAVGRAGTPDDITPAILFLCSDAARWINGTNLATDGGLEAAVTATTNAF
ncbi:MAG: NADP-dependent 3-hydroxy acid dehydrogenase YdfG [Sulfitobacter pontiacus]